MTETTYSFIKPTYSNFGKKCKRIMKTTCFVEKGDYKKERKMASINKYMTNDDQETSALRHVSTTSVEKSILCFFY